MWYVGKQRAERHDHLHADILRKARDVLRESTPAQVRLGAEEQDDVAIASGRAGCWNEPRPVDPPHLALESERRRVDWKSKNCSGSISANCSACQRRERNALAFEAPCNVVPPSERRHEWGASARAVLAAKPLARHRNPTGRQSRATNVTVAAHRAAASATCVSTSHHGSLVVPDLADCHLGREHTEHGERGLEPPERRTASHEQE